MRVSLITGSVPPYPCGVGGFTEKLAEELRAQGVEVALVTGLDWSAFSANRSRKQIAAASPDIVHIQYPTRGYRWSLGPHALSLSMKTVVTLHEFSQVHLLRTLSSMAFLLRSQMVFTTEFERASAQKWAPWIEGRSRVIPIANIVDRYQGAPLPRSGVAYFGLLRPKRGLEDFLEFARLLHSKSPELPIRIIGGEVPYAKDYPERLRSIAAGVPIEWHVNKSEAEVARLLSICEFAYLPFPEGATERRTSLIGAMVNGCVIISNGGVQSPARLIDAIEIAASPTEACESILKLQADRNKLEALRNRGESYIQQFKIENVAKAHIALYAELLSAKV